ncbi:MAG: hypothetical protein M0P71_00965 [Melioribacteraceae bacterium]|nr:hypothetical protein [Melioribacteraceae bacterium]
MKILKKIFENNGYGCNCCRRDEEYSEWIEESEMLSLREILYEAIECANTIIGIGGCVGTVYEKDGDVLYGFTSDIYTTGGDIYIVIRNSKYLIYSDSTSNKEKIFNKEEILKIYGK